LLRRRFIGSVAAITAAGSTTRAVGVGMPMRIGLTPVFLDNQVALLKAWRDHLQDQLERPVRFVQRGSYREIVDALRAGALEFGWVCGYPYVRHAADLRLTAVPVYQGAPLYRSYLIVPAVDERTRSFLDLRGKVFAYSDPDSNSGHLYPTYALTQLQERPGAFFRRTFFTWAHRSVVEAVSAQLADGGAVDGYVWDTLAKVHPDITARTRVVAKSPLFGFPPFVGHAGLTNTEAWRLRAALLGMSDSRTGREILGQLNLDGFVAGDPTLFDGIRRMMETMQGGASAPVS
jgi:phosphonate transport system substrate-binding protein